MRAEPGVTVEEARTVATLVLAGTGLWILSILARPLTPSRVVLLSSMAAIVIALFSLPAARRFFTLDLASATEMLAAIGIVALAGAALDGGWRLSEWARARWWPDDPAPAQSTNALTAAK